MTKEEIKEFVKKNLNQHVYVTIKNKKIKAFTCSDQYNVYFLQDNFEGGTPNNHRKILKEHNLDYEKSWALDSNVTDIELIDNKVWWW